jgi:hypothetical protein
MDGQGDLQALKGFGLFKVGGYLPQHRHILLHPFYLHLSGRRKRKVLYHAHAAFSFFFTLYLQPFYHPPGHMAREKAGGH